VVFPTQGSERPGDRPGTGADPVGHTLFGLELLDANLVDTDPIRKPVFHLHARPAGVDQPVLGGLLADVDPGLGVPDELLVEFPAVDDGVDERVVPVVEQSLEVLDLAVLEFAPDRGEVLVLAGDSNDVGSTPAASTTSTL